MVADLPVEQREIAAEELKICNKCHVAMPLDHFYFRRDTGTRRDACKVCHKLHCRAYNAAHRSEINTKSIGYYYKNHVACLERHRKYRASNPEYMRTYRATHREEIMASKKAYEQTHKEWRNTYALAYQKRRRSEDPGFRALTNLRSRVNLALRANSASKHGRVSTLIGCSTEKLRAHLESLWLPGMSWDNYGLNGWHVDHKLPCALFDLTDPLHQRACFHFTNLQPLWRCDNIRKSDNVPVLPEPHRERPDAPRFIEERRQVEILLGSEPWKRVEEIETELETMPQTHVPLNHVFAPGLYLREAFLPKGTLLTTRIHLVEHPFVISVGVVSVWTIDGGVVTLAAPHTGVTKPGTRRIIFVHEDCIWSTCHLNPTNETNPDEIVRRVTYTGGKFKELGGAKA